MALKGNLTDISIADLIQLNCQSGARARLTAKHGNQTLVLYFDSGEIAHAQVGDVQGEEAVYELLLWQDGTFEVEQGMETPTRTINIPWSALIMEGMRRLDERGQLPQAPPANPLEAALQDMAANMSFQGMAVISRDGVVLAAELPGQLDKSRVGAIAAGILSLSGRSVGQLARGNLLQTMIQGSEGNIIITYAGQNAVLIALVDKTISLGMAFLEARESAQQVAQIVGT
jgi:hypothetical protein